MSSTYVSLNVHIVFATKGRVPIIGESWIQDMHNYLGGTIRGLGATSLGVGGVADHVHLLAGLRGNQDVSELVREIKKGSNHWAQEHHFPGFAWQGGYAAFSFAPKDLSSLRQYVASQKEHHHHRSSIDELRELLLEAGLEINEQFFE